MLAEAFITELAAPLVLAMHSADALVHCCRILVTMLRHQDTARELEVRLCLDLKQSSFSTSTVSNIGMLAAVWRAAQGGLERQGSLDVLPLS